MGDSLSAGRLACILAVFFLLVALALAGYVIYVEVIDPCDEDKPIQEQFPGYFRTPQEQAVFEQQYTDVLLNRLGSTQLVPDRFLSGCSFNCSIFRSPNPPRGKREVHGQSPLMKSTDLHKTGHHRSKRQAIPIYNACCITTVDFINPDTLPDQDGNTVTLIQLSAFKQYFLVQNCSHAAGCTGCGCASEMSLVTAVVIGPTLSLVQIPSCCKCYNNLTPPSPSPPP